MNTECKFEQAFDEERYLQYVNGEAAVMHCHHYATIFTKLALDTANLGGPQNLFDAMEETAYLTLHRYFTVEGITSSENRISLAQQYFALAGLGQLSLESGPEGGQATMRHSHVDEGWIKKWGKNEKPVNLIGQGFLAGATAAIYNKPVGSYSVRETQSIVTGASSSKFTLTPIRSTKKGGFANGH